MRGRHCSDVLETIEEPILVVDVSVRPRTSLVA